MKSFLLPLKTQYGLTEGTLYECTSPRAVKPLGATSAIVFVDTVTDDDAIVGVAVNENISVFVNVTPEIAKELKLRYKYRESDQYCLL